MSNFETIEVETKRVGCDGGGALGHPLVYLEMGQKSTITCPYCSRTYQLKEGTNVSVGH
jgi:uncharacterized Zn-finger protein